MGKVKCQRVVGVQKCNREHHKINNTPKRSRHSTPKATTAVEKQSFLSRDIALFIKLIFISALWHYCPLYVAIVLGFVIALLDIDIKIDKE